MRIIINIALHNFKRIKKLLIIIDSKSTLQKISKSGIMIANNIITLDTRNLIIKSKIESRNIKLLLVLSYCHIKSNEMADHLVNIAKEMIWIPQMQ